MQALTLPKTKLSYRDGELVKHGPGDTVQARFRKPELQALRVVESTDYLIPTVIVLAMVALAFVAKTHIENPGWSWVVTIACLAIAGFGFAMIKVRKVLVVTSSGDVAYIIGDQFDDADGFVLAVNHQLADTSSAENHTP